ncbi:MAG: hypothetical protein MEQ07_07575 [Aquimonas sp.]|nr:hypothetical protein [Aquimonas sp.]
MRPSRWLQLALWLLGALSALALWMSALPSWALMLVPPLLALALWQLRRDPPVLLELLPSGAARLLPPAGDDQTGVDAVACEPLQLEQRGPVQVLLLRVQGRVRRWVAASDTLPPAQGRALRLWLQRHARPTP